MIPFPLDTITSKQNNTTAHRFPTKTFSVFLMSILTQKSTIFITHNLLYVTVNMCNEEYACSLKFPGMHIIPLNRSKNWHILLNFQRNSIVLHAL